MKKIILMAAVAAGALFTACDKTGNVTIKTDVDTIAYELGMAASPADMLPTFLVRMGSDSASVAEYLKGFKEGLALSDDAKSVAYELGKQHGMQTKQQMIANVSEQIFGEGAEETLDVQLFLAGFLDMIEGKSRLVVDSVEITQQMAQMELQQRVQDKMNERARVEYAPNKQAGEEFLAAKAKEEGVVALSNGVLYKVIKEGKKNGKKPALTDKIKVAYKGMTIDGEEFDSSESVEFPLASMIEGWKIAIPEMTEGSKWEIYIPQELAYGERGSMPSIKPFSALVFEVELFNVVAPAAKK
ncbi:MAG: FKBP-type peptidyl-prolyl cis-trans isomerase [Bacteroidaceae bacterium]|nr:FKBP-type peptidyl-prolyl cis-trans isomerase [Bacteroidaceae bacterium]